MLILTYILQDSFIPFRLHVCTWCHHVSLFGIRFSQCFYLVFRISVYFILSAFTVMACANINLYTLLFVCMDVCVLHLLSCIVRRFPSQNRWKCSHGGESLPYAINRNSMKLILKIRFWWETYNILVWRWRWQWQWQTYNLLQ